MHTDIKDAITTALPTDAAPVFTDGGSDAQLEDLAKVIVAHVITGTVNIDVVSSGVCANTATSPGAYAGTGTATAAGSIEGLSASTLATAIKGEWDTESLGDETNANRILAEKTADAIAAAVVEELEDNGHVTVTTTDASTRPVVAGGGAVTGAGTGTGRIVSITGSSLKGKIKAEMITAHGSDDTDFSGDTSLADKCIEGLANGIVKHILDDARVAVSTDLSPVICPPTGGAASATCTDDDAAIS